MEVTGTATQTAPGEETLELGPIGLNERLALIGLIEEGMRAGSSESPIVADLFSNLWGLVNSTARGARIDVLKSDDSSHGFKVFEINAETGENLGRLNLLYLKKPIPCYYLVYVEVGAPFRNNGLGNRVLKSFRDLLIEKSAMGVLDNIIPRNDPTYDIYLKLDWQTVEDVTGTPGLSGDGDYMIFVPPSFRGRDLKDPILKLLHHLKRKRASIDMRDNELMVKRTIEEFKDLYAALIAYFGKEIDNDEHSSLMRFMFTRFVTKLLGFRRRISRLVGFTGGESLEQIVVHPEIRSLPVQSYAPRDLAGNPTFEFGDREMWLNLPECFKTQPARRIEELPNYRRPSLVAWMAAKGIDSSDALTIGDLMDLGFDPTRLKEIDLGGREFIIERVQVRTLSVLERTKGVLERISGDLTGVRVRNAPVAANAALLVIRDRGNAYVLRPKVEGIHWEEAVEQLQCSPALVGLNKSMGLERLIKGTVRGTMDWLASNLPVEDQELIDQLSYFVSWDLEANRPKVFVDLFSSSIECLWIA
jgi:hypothetical protein